MLTAKELLAKANAASDKTTSAIEHLRRCIEEAAAKGDVAIHVPCQDLIPGTKQNPDYAIKMVEEKVIPRLKQEWAGTGLKIQYNSIVLIAWGPYRWGSFEEEAETL